MAVKLIADIARYIGLKSDTKPTGVIIGSTFLEYDCNCTYITYDGTNWNPLPGIEYVFEEYL